MIAEGEKIRLRWLEFDDLPFLLAVRNSGRFFLRDMRKFGLSDGIKWWEETDPYLKYMIIELHDGTPVGYMRTSDWDTNNGHLMVGADVHPDHRRNGYAFEAYTIFLDRAFNSVALGERPFNKVSLEVLAINEGAIALYEKLGFVHEGRKREDILRSGKYVDSIMMSILRSEFKNRT